MFTQALAGRAGLEPGELADDLGPLFEAILESVPAPIADRSGPTQLLVTTLQYSSYVGKIAVGKLTSGSLKPGQMVAHVTAGGETGTARIGEVFTFRNLKREAQPMVDAGNIVAVSGIGGVGIGDTITDVEDPRPLPPIEVEQPTVRMTFGVNTSPFAGREGTYVTGRQIRDRLILELEQNVALRVEDSTGTGEWIVSGRGELHLAILIETMRREGFEFAVSQPEVIFHETPQGRQEPFEEVYIEVTWADGLTVYLPRRVEADEEVQVGMRLALYTVFTRVRGQVFNRANAEVRQQVQEGDATPTIGTNRLTVTASGRRMDEVIDGLEVTPAVVTPNADGRNDVAQIGFNLFGVSDANVEIAIHSMSGIPVFKLERSVGSGRHRARWDGRTADGRLVAPGLYLAQVRVKTGRGAFQRTVSFPLVY